MKYDLIIFDLDGTTLDTAGDLTAALNVALREAGMPERTKKEVLTFVGNGIRKMVERAAEPGISSETLDALCATFRSRYSAHCMDRTLPYEGIVPLLKALKEKNIRTAVSSNKDEGLVELLCRELLQGLPDMTVGSGGAFPRKPDPAGTLEIVRRFGIPKDRVLYVGDSRVDLQTARNAGLNGVFVTWGFTRPDEVKSWNVPVADTVEELRTMIFREELPLHVRRAGPEDAEAIFGLLKQVLAVHAKARPDYFKPVGTKYTKRELLELLSDDRKPVFVCEDGSGKVIGHCFCQIVDREETAAVYGCRELYIDDLCVDANSRRQHAGETLYRTVRNYARENGFRRITLHVWEGNPAARAFYDRMGMHVQQTTMEENL